MKGLTHVYPNTRPDKMETSSSSSCALPSTFSWIPDQYIYIFIGNLRFELNLLLFYRQSNFHLHYNFLVNSASAFTYYKTFILFHQSKFNETKVIFIVVLTQTTSLLNHLNPLLCYVMFIV